MVVSMLFVLLVFTIMSSTKAQPEPLALGSLVWSEEFSSDGPLDSSRWSFDLGHGNWGWGNGEVQEYTQSMDNARVEDGHLVIDVKKTVDSNGNNKFTSARVRTNGKVEFQYGSVEARVKLPDLSNGYWPALWMLGRDFYEVGWPHVGEIDIMEAGQAVSIDQGTVNNVVSSAAHWSHEGNYATHGEHVHIGMNFVNQWLLFRMDWTPHMISTFVNGQHIWSLDISSCGTDSCSEFHQPYYFIANMAVGGQFTGIMNANDITASPGQMEIDYIRIYNNEVVDATMTIGGILQAPPKETPASSPTTPSSTSSPTMPAPASSPTGSSPTHFNSLPDPSDNGSDNYAADYGIIDCGVSQSCTGSVLNTVAGSSTCLGHIQYLMDVRGRDELYACDSVARKDYPTECGACDPGTGAPTVNYQFNCGDNTGTHCNDIVLNRDAPMPIGSTCGERISHLIEVENESETSACARVAGQDFPGECGPCIHNVISCGQPADSACSTVLDDLAGSYTCRSRIAWMVYNEKYTETEACLHVATNEESSSVCGPCLPP